MNNHNCIDCHGIRTHNLKNIDVALPLKKWIAVTGVSGSGKSSLVFDTIYAESQRRFLETLGTYERQFLQGLPQGEFDSIENLPASVALKQSNKTGDPRSVIATVADIADSMRILFMSFMDSACIHCGNSVIVNKSQDLLDFISGKESVEKNNTYLISVPFVFPEDKKKQKKICQDLLIEGYVRLLSQGKVISLEEAMDEEIEENVEIVLDRINAQLNADEILNRVETIWSQIKFSTRFSYIYTRTLKDKNIISSQNNLFHVQPYCEKCKQKTAIIQSSDLDWQSVLGACKKCHGLGNIPVLDENKIIPNPLLSLAEGAIKPWNSDTFSWMKEELLRECKKRQIDVKIPFQKLKKTEKDFIWYGEGQLKTKTKSFLPIKHFFDVLEEERYKSTSRILLAKYRKYINCPACLGTRIGEIGRNAVCFGKTFPELFNCEIKDTLYWLENIRKEADKSTEKKPSKAEMLTAKKLEAIYDVYQEILNKISLLVKLGLGSANLFRRCKTLSGGEYQRVLLTRVIGNGLTDALYVLDEPSVGLGQNEIPELIDCIRKLRDLGNTVLMVEHDKSLIFAADEVIELGPGGGKEGGDILPIINKIPASAVMSSPGLTGGSIRIPVPPATKLDSRGKSENDSTTIYIKKFSAMNCKNIDLEIYLGKLNVITGPSGAGKSTLLHYGLQSALEKLEETGIHFNAEANYDAFMGLWEDIKVPQNFFVNNSLVIVEQKAMHRTITSVPATLMGLMDILRKSFAQTVEAKQAGFDASDFSFNGAGGCETCNGKGIVEEDLFFLGQVEKMCPDCEGTRYKKEVLNIVWRGKNIHQWLSSTLQECFNLLGREKGFGKSLFLACELGLGHISLGLPTSSMSGGEAQRLRISSVLCKSTKKIICILDEPTRGLSEKDIGHLLECLLRLSRDGHTFIVVEHHNMFEYNADHLIKMGPGSGAYGGEIVERTINYNAAK